MLFADWGRIDAAAAVAAVKAKNKGATPAARKARETGECKSPGHSPLQADK